MNSEKLLLERMWRYFELAAQNSCKFSLAALKDVETADVHFCKMRTIKNCYHPSSNEPILPAWACFLRKKKLKAEDRHIIMQKLYKCDAYQLSSICDSLMGRHADDKIGVELRKRIIVSRYCI